MAFSFKERLKSFRYAFSGLWVLLKTQHNAWIHVVATLLAIGAGFFFGIRQEEWCFLVIAIGGVWMAEAFNTALEFLADAVHPEKHPLVGQAKDAAAGAVLIAAIASVVIGLLIFGPYALKIFQ